jgi:predicted transglutaminase-like cysteine proteinase
MKCKDKEVPKISELLAILHGDGGHYQSEHGLDKAIEDAIKLIHTKWVTNERINELVRRLEIMEDLIEYSGAKDYWKYDRNKWSRALEEYEKIKKIS